MMTAWGYLFSGWMCSATGMPKAQVLPVPVGALAITSCPASMTGMVFFLDLGHFGKAHALHRLVDGFAALQFTVKHSDNSVLFSVEISISRNSGLVSTKRAAPCWRGAALCYAGGIRRSLRQPWPCRPPASA